MLRIRREVAVLNDQRRSAFNDQIRVSTNDADSLDDFHVSVHILCRHVRQISLFTIETMHFYFFIVIVGTVQARQVQI